MKNTEQASVEFGRSGPDAITRVQPAAEKERVLARSGLGRRRGVVVPTELAQDIKGTLDWLSSALQGKIRRDAESIVDRYWHINKARTSIRQLSELLGEVTDGR